MRKTRWPLMAALMVGGVAMAQDVKLTACVDLWYTQMLSSDLRTNLESGNYYPLRSDFKENGFSVRRTEIYLNGKISDAISWAVTFDPNTTASSPAWAQKNAATPNILFDASITWKFYPGFELKVGQFKAPTSYEATLVGSPALLFYDRSMINRQYNDRRDRGLQVSYGFGEAKAFNGKAVAMVSNGTSDWDFGRANDLNAQKDFTVRLEMGYGPEQKFGVYHRTGGSDQADKGSLKAASTFGGVAVPAGTDVLGDFDKTTTTGAYYYYDTAKLHGSVELITGLLGRRRPSVQATTSTTPFAASREHLDQKFLSYVISGAYKFTPKHWITARYDYANYNSGDQWYGPHNPYTQNVTTGAALATDYSPAFTEVVLGYTYNFVPTKYTMANLKLNYVMRSKNFLQPLAPQTGEQGGDSLVVALQVAF